MSRPIFRLNKLARAMRQRGFLLSPGRFGGGGGGLTISVAGTGSGTSTSSTTVSCTTSASPATGDIILAAVSQDPQTSTAYGTMTGPTGFTQLAQQATSVWSRVTVWYKVSNGSEGTSYSASSSLTQSDMTMGVVIYRPSAGGTLSLGTPVTQSDTGSNTAWTIPALTTTQNNSWAIAIVGGGGNNAHGSSTIFTTWNGGYSEDLDAALNANWTAIGFGHQLVPTTTTVAATSVTCATTDTSQSVVVELKIS